MSPAREPQTQQPLGVLVIGTGFSGVFVGIKLKEIGIDNFRIYEKINGIAVIGSAASAIQVIPDIANTAAKVTVLQRTPNYVIPRGDRDYTEKEKQRFSRWPLLQRLYR